MEFAHPRTDSSSLLRSSTSFTTSSHKKVLCVSHTFNNFWKLEQSSHSSVEVSRFTMATMADMCGSAPTIDMYPNMFDQDAVGALHKPQLSILVPRMRVCVHVCDFWCPVRNWLNEMRSKIRRHRSLNSTRPRYALPVVFKVLRGHGCDYGNGNVWYGPLPQPRRYISMRQPSFCVCQSFYPNPCSSFQPPPTQPPPSPQPWALHTARPRQQKEWPFVASRSLSFS